MPRDSEQIEIDYGQYRGFPTFALRGSSNTRRPLLMNKRGGRFEKTEEELVRDYSSYVRNGAYAYNPNGLTYGDVNALMNDTGNWFDDWDGHYAIYDWDENKYGFQMVEESLTKEASVGMIIGQGDPSSPPSGIFMADEYPPRAMDYRGPEHYELVLRKTSTPMSNGEYGFCLTKALTPRLDWMATRHSRPRLFMEDAMILNHRNENMNGLIYDDEIMTSRPMNPAEERLYFGALAEGTGNYLEPGPWSFPLVEYTHFQAEDPTRAEASDLGGPTEPGNAGVPADVGGDDLVPYDSPSAPPAGIFMNAESKVYESKPFKNVMLGIAFTISALTFWSTAGTAVKTYVVSVVDTYAPKLLEPQNKIIITTLALVGIVYFGSRLRSENQPLNIPSAPDLDLLIDSEPAI